MTPVAKTGLHCGDGIARAYGFTDAGVTPVAKTGLHCGDVFVTGEDAITEE